MDPFSFGFDFWDDVMRPDSVRNQPRETVDAVVVAHALKGHFFGIIYEDPVVASLRDGKHDYAMGETPAKFNFDILVLLAGLSWIAGFGRSMHGLTRDVLAATISFAVDAFVEGNWIGTPYLERATEKLDGDVRDYFFNAYTNPEGVPFGVNRGALVETAAEKLAFSADSSMGPQLERLVTEQLTKLEDLLDHYIVDINQ
jgi:hypothetical protein